ncbi:Inosine-5'-monophosphate dehydrogenase [wastewater metagenome]|uniref:Inosine-5'-monophosphate dehydrogenase n=2 Tax=unclassified sequences TaxID=12908 RepID=A0A5B8RDZ1_9ZZZZ|nr:inosine-5'-monophosphate dehydrogenase [uncultured organism]
MGQGAPDCNVPAYPAADRRPRCCAIVAGNNDTIPNGSRSRVARVVDIGGGAVVAVRTLGDMVSRGGALTVAPDAGLPGTLARMRRESTDAVVVIEDGRPVGILTERDAVRLAYRGWRTAGVSVAGVMTRHPVTAPVSMDYREAYRLVVDRQLRHLVVVDADGRLAGLVGDGEFMQLLAGELSAGLSAVAGIMTHRVHSLGETATVADAVALMVHHQVSCVVLERGARPVGIFTERDLVRIEADAAGAVEDEPLVRFASMPVHTVAAGASVAVAVARMDEAGVRRLVVTGADGVISGLVTRHDIVRELYGRHIDDLLDILSSREAEVGALRAELQAEHELHRSEALLAETQRIAEIGSWSRGEPSRGYWWSSQVFRLLALDPAETPASPRALLSRVHPDDRERVAATPAGGGGAPDEGMLSYRLVLPDGRLRHVQQRWHRAGGSCGRDGQVIGTIQDMSGLHEAEARASAEAERFRLFFERNASVMLIIDPAGGGIIAANQAACAFYGYSPGELVGMPIGAINTLPPAELKRQMARAVGQSRNHFEFRHRLADGEERDVEVYSTPVREDDRELLFTIVHDVTERRRAEERLALDASVFTHAREGIAITDADNRIVDVNDAFTRITGYSREEALGNTPALLKSGRQPDAFYRTMWRSLNESGHWSGEIWNRRRDGAIYAEMLTISVVRDEHGRVCNHVALFSDITEEKRRQRQLEHIAHYDALTDLPNRVLLGDRLAQAMARADRDGHSLSLVYLDLDGFKRVNESHGHEVGDAVITTIAGRLGRALRATDTLARIGGDEFVAVLADIDPTTDDEGMLARLADVASRAVEIDGRSISLTASLGVTGYPQAESVDAEQLLRQADQAMYQAKLAGRNRVHVFDVARDRDLRGFHEDVARMRQALADDELTVFYQPKVNMRTGELVGAEALVRWHHPEQGLLGPARFLPAIEGHPVSLEIGERVLHRALAQLAAWQAEGLTLPLSVNIGALQLQQPDFPERLHHILAGHPGVDPGLLRLEVLETSALEDMVHVTRVMRECARLGVYFSLDDFGTGYASLTYLKRLPVVELKIDRSFVADSLEDAEDFAIVEGVMGLARAFGHDVVAEGVENEAQGELLLKLGCELAQGFAIARPMPPEALPAWRRRWRPYPRWSGQETVPQEMLPLHLAGIEHRLWMQALEGFLDGCRAVPPAMDHRECRFGQWLDRERVRRGAEAGALDELDRRHRRVHRFARAMLTVHERGDSSRARQGLSRLKVLGDRLLACLGDQLPARSDRPLSRSHAQGGGPSP